MKKWLSVFHSEDEVDINLCVGSSHDSSFLFLFKLLFFLMSPLRGLVFRVFGVVGILNPFGVVGCV